MFGRRSPALRPEAGDLGRHDKITFIASSGGSTVLTVARISKHKILVGNSDSGKWRLNRMLPSEPKSEFIYTCENSEWTIGARSA
jgi:hypothetical protein